jgi:hypothetical protein
MDLLELVSFGKLSIVDCCLQNFSEMSRSKELHFVERVLIHTDHFVQSIYFRIEYISIESEAMRSHMRPRRNLGSKSINWKFFI